MQKLNLPEYEHRIRKNEEDGLEIFDPVRRKFVALLPEEWVRQNLLRYLITEKNIPQTLIKVEVALTLNTMQRRSDIVAYNRTGSPLLAVECKSPTVAITQDVFDQLARYNLVLRVPYLIVSNGLKHFCCKIDFSTQTHIFLPEIPNYAAMLNYQ